MTAATLAGSRREIFSLAWPIWISMTSVTIKGVVDMIMVGELGTSAVAGVGLAGVLAFNVLCFAMGVLRSQKPLISQYIGAGDSQESFRYGVQGWWLACLFAVISLVIALAQDDLFMVISSSASLNPDALRFGREYFDSRLAWGGTMLLYLAVSEYLRGTGRTRLPMVADLVSQPLNIVCNYALIFGAWGFPKMGVAGAAVGTGIADLLSLIIILAFSKKPGLWSQLGFNWKRFKRVFTVGAAGGIQFTVEVGAFSLITFLIGYISTEDLAAHSAVINILHFSFMFVSADIFNSIPFCKRQIIFIYKLSGLNFHVLVVGSTNLFFIGILHNLNSLLRSLHRIKNKFWLHRVRPTYHTLCSSSCFILVFVAPLIVLLV